MHAIAESFKSAGAVSYLMLLIGGASVALSVVGVVVSFAGGARSSSIFSTLAFASVLGIEHCAFLQRTTTLWAIKRSLPAVAADQQHLLVAKGVSEIAGPMVGGLVLFVVPLLAGAFLWARGARAQPEAPSGPAASAIAALALVGAAAFAFGLLRYAAAIASFQVAGSDWALTSEHGGPHEGVILGDGALAALASGTTLVLGVAALLVALAQRRRINRLSGITTVLTVVFGLIFAATGQAFAIDSPREFGRASQPLIVVRPGLELPTTASRATPSSIGLVEITPDAIFVDGVKVVAGKPLVAALKQAPVLDLNASVMPLVADRRATFAQLAHVLDAAEVAGHHRFELIAEPRPAYRAVRFRAPSTTAPPADNRPVLGLTVRVTTSGFLISGNGGNLEPMPLDFGALNTKLAEIRVSFPDERSVTLAPAGAVSVEALVKTCDAVMLKGNQLLFDDLVISFPRED